MQMFSYTVPKVIDFPRYNTIYSGENIKYFVYCIVSSFPLHFVLYLGNLDVFLDSVQGYSWVKQGI